MTLLLAPEPERPVQPGPIPSFSILIAAYQAAAFIGDAIESALAQTLPAREVVVCDDGSTDDLAAALEPYADRLVVVRQENQGPGAAKDRAAREATGDFLVILDADDVYDPTRLEALGAAAAARPDLDILATDAYVELNGRRLRRAYDASWTFEAVDQRRAILERCFIVGHAAVRRERFVQVGGFDAAMRTVDDWDLWMRMILDGSRVGLIPEPLSSYRVRAGSVSTQSLAVLQGSITCLDRAWARDDLTLAERDVLGRSLARTRRELALFHAREAVRRRRPDARRKLAGVAVTSGYDARTRLKAAAAALAPSQVALRFLERESTPSIGAAGVPLDSVHSDR